jgi:hypothetical protein
LTEETKANHRLVYTADKTESKDKTGT